jgi:hypothetical protein
MPPSLLVSDTTTRLFIPRPIRRCQPDPENATFEVASTVLSFPFYDAFAKNPCTVKGSVLQAQSPDRS